MASKAEAYTAWDQGSGPESSVYSGDTIEPAKGRGKVIPFVSPPSDMVQLTGDAAWREAGELEWTGGNVVQQSATRVTRRGFALAGTGGLATLFLAAAGNAWALPIAFLSITMLLVYVNAFYLTSGIELIPRGAAFLAAMVCTLAAVFSIAMILL